MRTLDDLWIVPMLRRGNASLGRSRVRMARRRSVSHRFPRWSVGTIVPCSFGSSAGRR